MKVSRTDVNALFDALEMPMAAKWSEKRLMDKLSKLPDIVDEDTDAGECQDLLDSILTAVTDGDEIEITDEDEDEKPKKGAKKSTTKKTPAKGKAKGKKAKQEEEEEPEEEDEEGEEEDEKPKKSKGKKATSKSKSTKKEVYDDVDDEEEEEETKPKSTKKGPPKKAAPKGPGVIASIVEFLQKASQGKPITKDTLCEKLAERFPDRDPDSMMRTINVQVPNRLKTDKGITVDKNEKGYFIVE